MATRADYEQRCRASERGRLETNTFFLLRLTSADSQ